MIVNNLTGKNATSRTFNINDLSENTKEFFDVKLKKEELKPTYSLEEVAPIGKNVFSAKNIFGELHIVTDGGSVLKYVNGNFYNVMNAEDEQAKLAGVLYQGVQSLLVLSQTKGATILSIGEKYSVDINYSNVYWSFSNALFIAMKNRIHFANFSHLDCFPGENFITFPAEVGNVVALNSYDKKLLIFCERAVYCLTVFGNTLDYEIERLFDVSKGVDGQSVCLVDGIAYFLSGGNLCAMQGGSIERIFTVIDFEKFTVSGKATSYDGKYLIPIKSKKDGKDYLFIYGVHTGAEELKEGCYLMVDGGLAVINDGGNKLVKLAHEDKETVGKWTSKLLDFSSLARKVIKQITFFSKNDAELTVRGEYGEKRFSIKNGINVLKLNLCGRVFSLELVGKGLAVKNFEIIYRIKGE